MISCAEAVERLWEHLEQGPEEASAAGLEAHLARCRRCCGEAEFAAELRRWLQAAALPYLPPPVESRLLRFIDAMQEPV